MIELQIHQILQSVKSNVSPLGSKNKKKRPEWKPPNAFIFNVENIGIEPMTSWLPVMWIYFAMLCKYISIPCCSGSYEKCLLCCFV